MVSLNGKWHLAESMYCSQDLIDNRDFQGRHCNHSPFGSDTPCSLTATPPKKVLVEGSQILATTTTHLLGSLKLHDWHILSQASWGSLGWERQGDLFENSHERPHLERRAPPYRTLSGFELPRIRRIRPAMSIHLTGPCGPFEIEFEIDEIGDFLDASTYITTNSSTKEAQLAISSIIGNCSFSSSCLGQR